MKCYSNFNCKRRLKGKVHLPLISIRLPLSPRAPAVNLVAPFQFYKVVKSTSFQQRGQRFQTGLYCRETLPPFPRIRSGVAFETDSDTEPEISFPGARALNTARCPCLCMKQSRREMKPCTPNKQHKYLICSLMDPNMGFRGHVNDPTK